MNLKSLAHQTELIFDRFSSTVTDRGNYHVVRTDARPTYFWGNYLIMPHPPREGDFEPWLALFEREIGTRDERGFVAITWDSTDGESGSVQPFLDAGFAVNKGVIMTAREVCRPPKYNKEVVVRPLHTDEDWQSYDEIHFDPEWEYGSETSQRAFIASSREQLRAMVDAGLGMRFGAELDGKLVGDAGLYWDGKIARFNNVGTHRDYRRLGVCSTLIHVMCEFGFDERRLEVLVMVADEDYHAAAIYESIGFRPTEKVARLEWFDRAKF